MSCSNCRLNTIIQSCEPCLKSGLSIFHLFQPSDLIFLRWVAQLFDGWLSYFNGWLSYFINGWLSYFRLYIYDLPIDSGCTQNIPVLILGGSEKNIIANELYSAILMAKASGKQVTIQTTGCWSGWSTPVITSMYIHD